MKFLYFLLVCCFANAEIDLTKDAAKDYDNDKKLTRALEESTKWLKINGLGAYRSGNFNYFSKELSDFKIAQEIAIRNFGKEQGGIPLNALLITYATNSYIQLKKRSEATGVPIDMVALNNDINKRREILHSEMKVMIDQGALSTPNFDAMARLIQAMSGAAKMTGDPRLIMGSIVSEALVGSVNDINKSIGADESRLKTQNEFLHGHKAIDGSLTKAWETGYSDQNFRLFYYTQFLKEGSDLWADAIENFLKDTQYRDNSYIKKMLGGIYAKLDKGVFKFTDEDLKKISKNLLNEMAQYRPNEGTNPEEAIQAMYSSVNLVSSLAQLTGNAKLARVVSVGGAGVAQIVSALYRFSTPSYFNAINIAAAVTQGVGSILNAIMGAKTESEVLMDAVNNLSKQVDAVKAELVARLEIIDLKIDQLLNLTVEGFQKILWVLGDIDRRQAEIKETLSKIDQNLNDLRGEIRNQFDSLHEQNIGRALGKCLSDEDIDVIEFRNCLFEYRQVLETSPLIHRLSEAGLPEYPKNLEDKIGYKKYYFWLNEHLDESPWKKISTISKLIKKDFNIDIESHPVPEIKSLTGLGPERHGIADDLNLLTLSTYFFNTLGSYPRFHRIEFNNIDNLAQSFIDQTNINLQAAKNLRSHRSVVVKVIDDHKAFISDLKNEITSEKAEFEKRNVHGLKLGSGITNAAYADQDLSSVYKFEPIGPCHDRKLVDVTPASYTRESLPQIQVERSGNYAVGTQDYHPEMAIDPKLYPPLVSAPEWKVTDIVPKVFLAGQAVGLGKIMLCYANVRWDRVHISPKFLNRVFTKTDELNVNALVSAKVFIKFHYSDASTDLTIGSFSLVAEKNWQNVGVLQIVEGNPNDSGWIETGAAFDSGSIVKNVWEGARGNKSDDWLVKQPEVKYEEGRAAENYVLDGLQKALNGKHEQFKLELIKNGDDKQTQLGGILAAMTGSKKLLANILQITHPNSIEKNEVRSLIYGKNGLLDTIRFSLRAGEGESLFNTTGKVAQDLATFIFSDNDKEDVNPIYLATLNRMRTLKGILSTAKPSRSAAEVAMSYRKKIDEYLRN